MTAKFIWGADNAPQLFVSAEAADKAVIAELIAVAATFGFDALQTERGHVLCGKAATGLLVAVKADGTWEFRDAEGDEVKSVTGQGSGTLRWFLQTS